MLKSLLCISFSIVLFCAINDANAVMIYQRPDGLGAGNNWPVGTFESINESSQDDSDFITSSGIVQNQHSTVVFSLSNGEDPVVDIAHFLRYAFRENGLSVNSPNLEVTLQQGDTNLFTWTEIGPLPNVFRLSSREIPSSVVGQISNYGDLRLKFTVVCNKDHCPDKLSEETVSVSWAELQYETFTTPRDHPLPKITGIGFYKIETKNETGQIIKILNYSKLTDLTDLQNYRNYTKTGRFYPIGIKIPTFDSEINQPVQVQVKLDGVFASTRIEHLSLISTDSSSENKSPKFEIIAEKGKNVNVIDPTKIIKDVKFTYSLEDGSLWVNFDIVFGKSLEKSNIILQTWDEQRRPIYSEIFDAWKITDSDEKITTTKNPPEIVKISILKMTTLSCLENKTCFVPMDVGIRKGGIVMWKNNDSVIHTIVSGNSIDGPDGRINTALVPGDFFEHIFPFEGVYTYYCSLHPWYNGKIIVSDAIQNPIQEKNYYFELSMHDGQKIVNGQIITADNQNNKISVSGHLSKIKKPTLIEILIKSPDSSTEILTTLTNSDGEYFIPLNLGKKFQMGKFQVISKMNGIEIGHVDFTITNVKIKNK